MFPGREVAAPTVDDEVPAKARGYWSSPFLPGKHAHTHRLSSDGRATQVGRVKQINQGEHVVKEKSRVVVGPRDMSLADAAIRLGVTPAALFNSIIRRGMASQLRKAGARRAITTEFFRQLEAEAKDG